MIYVDPSETRSTSKFAQFVSSEKYQAVNGLEEITGADLMITLDNLPAPINLPVVKMHIQHGAKLCQLKFGHDLSSSMIDGRIKWALYKMRKLGSAPWQSVLVALGAYYEGSEGELMINGSEGYTHRTFRYTHFLAQLTLWNDRGGSFCHLPSYKDLAGWLDIQNHLISEYKSLSQKVIWPRSPVLYDNEIELDNEDLLESLTLEAQLLIPVTDIRILYATLPGIGPSNATKIYNDANIKDIHSFLSWLDKTDPRIRGIGTKTKKKIKEFLGVK